MSMGDNCESELQPLGLHEPQQTTAADVHSMAEPHKHCPGDTSSTRAGSADTACGNDTCSAQTDSCSSEGEGRKLDNIIPGVEHVFFEKEMEKMEHQTQEEHQPTHIVVLGVDNSVPSDLAFKFYTDNVNRPGYELHVVHHSNYFGNYEPMDGGPSPKHCQEMVQKEDGKVKEMEKKYKDLMKQHNIKGEFVCIKGKDTWHDIIKYQEKIKAIMIVMGTRGQNTLKRTFLGSVSDSVVHHASCPVLVCCHPKA